MPRGKKRSPEEITQVLTAYAISNNLEEVSRLTKIPSATVKNIVDRYKDSDEFKELQEKKKEQFSTRANRVIDKAMELLERKFDTALDNQKEIEELISIIMNDDSSEEKMSYQEKLAIAKRLGKLQINGLSEITTSLGTLYDKMRIAEDKPTENNKLDVTIRVIE